MCGNGGGTGGNSTFRLNEISSEKFPKNIPDAPHRTASSKIQEYKKNLKTMPDNFELRLTGRLAPGNQVSARTLSHSLMHIQRAVDKMVIFDKRGVLRKYAGLKSIEYAEADLIVQQFERAKVGSGVRGVEAGS